MTPDQAAWVRAHVWPPQLQALAERLPARYTTCACQRGVSRACARGTHDRCPRDLVAKEGVVTDRSGVDFVAFATPYAHRTVTVDGPPLPTPVAQVWLADRVCRGVCPCTCGHPRPAVAPRYELVPLPGLGALDGRLQDPPRQE